jgi:hypothetical protein
MPDSFARELYNITGMYVAALQNDNTYGDPVAVDLLMKADWDVEADTDELKSAGMIVSTLAIPTKATGTLSQGALDFAAMVVLCGFANGSYGVDPTDYNVMDVLLGGAGLPFWGGIVRYEGTLGSNALIGFPKAKLQKVPGFTVNQNKFRIGEAAFDAVAPSTTHRGNVRMKKYRTATAIPTTAAAFLNFFQHPTDMFA